MASLRDHFQHFYTPDEDAVATAIETGLVTPDTNVLLSLYRFQAGARDELFRALEKLGDRLWIPHQVGLEFHRNRLIVIQEQQEYFGKTRKDLEDHVAALRGKVRAFAARISLGEDRVKEIDASLDALRSLLTSEVNNAEDANEVHLDKRDSDEVLARLEVVLGSRVGEPMEPGELEAARKEAKRRVEAKIPPGYMDKGKADPAGDYLVWRQLMTEARERKLPVVLITDDRKEDWYRREHGLTLGARYELREEMMAEAGVPFLIMTTETFLLHAKKYLDAEVSPETVDQAKELIIFMPHPGPGAYQRHFEIALPDFVPGRPMSLAETVMATLVLWQIARQKSKKTEQGQIDDTDLADLAKFTTALGMLDTPAEPQQEEQQEQEGESSADGSDDAPA